MSDYTPIVISVERIPDHVLVQLLDFDDGTDEEYTRTIGGEAWRRGLLVVKESENAAGEGGA